MRRLSSPTRAAAMCAVSVLLGGVHVCAFCERAFAGGFEFPDNGTEALGRGAAFTAKADDPTAIQYNVAGLARQRGTRVLFNGNLNFHSYTFQRSGTYPDDPTNPKTPWGGAPYGLVQDTSAPFFAPFIAATTDFNYFDRLTFAIGVFGPSGIGERTYPLGVNGAPSAARYDLVQAKPVVIYPTIAAAYRVTPWLDLGVGLALAIGNFDLTTVSYAYISPAVCPTPEYQPCDAQNHLVTSGNALAPSFGAMVRPAGWLALGLNVRSGYKIDSTGTATATAPAAAAAIKIDPSPATFSSKFPWVIRAGARIIAMKNGSETADVEIDGTYETWGSAQGQGPQVNIPKLGIYDDIHPTVQHDYNNTFSIRVGGAYNFPVASGILSLRGGGYFDSSATDAAATRVDFDTLTKIALTAGVGYKFNGMSLNLALAEVFEPDRTVTDGTQRPINGANHGLSTAMDGTPLPVTNNGTYSAHMHILSFGISVIIDEIFGFARKVPAMNDYEETNAVAPMDKDKDAEKIDDASPSDEKKNEPDNAVTSDAPTTTPEADATPAPPPPRKPRKPRPRPKPHKPQPKNDLEL